MRGDGGPAAVGGHREPDDTAELPGGEPARDGAGRGTGRRGELQGVLALGVRHPHHVLLAVHAEGARQPGAYAVFGGEGAGGPGAVGDPVDGAADGDRAAASGVVGRGGPEPAGRAHGVRLEVGALSAEPDVEASRLGPVEVVEEPQLTGRGVDDAGAVGGRVPGVEAVDRGVPAQVRAVREGGVQRPDAFVVGEERDALSHPGRVLDVPVQVRVEAYELAGLFPLGVPVDPQLARRTAAVALPPGRLAPHGSGQQEDAGAAVRDVADGPVRQGGRGAAVERDGAGPAAAQ
ncbi:hypothetical protein SAV31267_035200 [Streptomyces avermitilis]|uniref:Uncharacterized protein n=1 Tax=Streptomyces avermitilis TaxID=33903 RepID=A0A4D4MRB9_STRAX|nr:hypothetical protein SAV31267_035200 [Streptomyces avermitilis]